MIHSLTGILTGKGDNVFYLNNGGLEWEIIASIETLAALPDTGNEVRVYTFLYHKEDAMKLFGFHSMAERSLFFDLIKVNGVGPGLAVRILSGMPLSSFITYLDKGDETALSKIPGLGKKTAQKIILALRGKITSEQENKDSERFRDIIEALAEMGFDRKKAADAVRELADEVPGNPDDEAYEKELFRLGIKRLSTG
ncbi:MAG: Holliday junction branch migration protein RuvA [Spirochaetales bacterium]|nr:Holliday junction branch migration protein RuvA [Spirochaetales bacterium]